MKQKSDSEKCVGCIGNRIGREIAMMVREEGKGEREPKRICAGRICEDLEGIQALLRCGCMIVMPCVVGVSNRARTYSIISGQTDVIEQATGSGVMITTQGHMVTNYHVIEGQMTFRYSAMVSICRRRLSAMTRRTDLAVLRVIEDV